MSQKSGLNQKEKRIKEAVIKYYMEDKTQEQVAQEMDVSRKTVQRYLDSDFAQNLKRVYSDQELFDLKGQIETEIRDSKKLAENLLSQAISHEDVTPRDLLKAAKQAQQIPKNHIQMLKELGIIDEAEKQEEQVEEDKHMDIVSVMREEFKKAET